MSSVRVLRLSLLLAIAPAARAQQYVGRIDSWMQHAAFRGFEKDSIPAANVVTGPDGGPQTPDGFAVSCLDGQPQCYFYRAGPALSGGPFVTSASITAWGFGVRGLSIHGTGRVATNIGSSAWPGTSPSLSLLEGYAEYAGDAFTARAGRQIERGRLGWYGFDGGRLAWRVPRTSLTAIGYGGFGLANASALTVANEIVNPLGDFQPPERQWLAGAAMEWQARLGEARLDFEREIDLATRNIVSKRMALSASFVPYAGWSLSGGADYDLARGLWGSADVTLLRSWSRYGGSIGVRQYRPYFDLWSIWGVFSPVPYTAANAAVWASPVKGLTVRAGGERYRYADARAETPLLAEQTRGWRWNAGGSYALGTAIDVDAGYHAEFGPGAAFSGVDGSVSLVPKRALGLTLLAGHMVRPLELRVEEPALTWLGAATQYVASDRLQFRAQAIYYAEDRRRPDAAAIDWSQTRFAVSLSWLFGTNIEDLPLPRAVPVAERMGGQP
jgi:hypothetical protein